MCQDSAAVRILMLVLFAAAVSRMEIGHAPSGSAIQDLKAELESIYGAEYSGKETESGLQDMVFEVKPGFTFVTNWNLRNTLGWDYPYICKVVFTNYGDAGEKRVDTVTYRGVDPMGKEHAADRAHLILESRKES